MEVVTLAAALLGKEMGTRTEMEPLKAQLEETRVQLQSVRAETAGWRKAARSAYAKGLAYAQRAKKMEVLAVVQSYLTERARVGQVEVTYELSVSKSELEVVRHKVVSLEFELASEQKKMGEVQEACNTAKERLEEALINNEELRYQA